MSFPKCYQLVENELKSIQVLPMMEEQVKRDIQQDTEMIESCLTRIGKVNYDIANLSDSQKKPKYLSPEYLGQAAYRQLSDELKAALAEAEEWIKRGKSQFELLQKINPKSDVVFDGTDFDQRLVAAKLPPETAPVTPREKRPSSRLLFPGEEATPATPRKRNKDEAPELPQEPPEKKPRAVEELYPKQPMAIQILLKDGKVEEMKAGGRPPSPFSGTMGAHTTAWIVHLDHVRRYILGKTVAEAITAVTHDLVPDARKMYARIGAGAADIEPEHEKRLGKAKETLENSVQKAKGQVNPLFLQQYIQHLLTYINFIPNATIDKADTTGKGEPTPRNTLREHEKNQTASSEALREAIRKLFDGRRKGSIWENHLRIISQTYPQSFAGSGYVLNDS